MHKAFGVAAAAAVLAMMSVAVPVAGAVRANLRERPFATRRPYILSLQRLVAHSLLRRPVHRELASQRKRPGVPGRLPEYSERVCGITCRSHPRLPW
jgi:hypothetical protein